MIRSFITSDLPEIVYILQKGSVISVDNILEQFKLPLKVIVYYDKRVKGVACAFKSDDKYFGKKVNILIYVDPGEEGKGIGNKLFRGIWEIVMDVNPDIVITYYKDNNKMKFFLNNGFSIWYSWSVMEYHGGKKEEKDLRVCLYKETMKEIYLEEYKKAFFDVRRENQVKPYYIQDDEKIRRWLEKYKETTYMFYEGDKFIGSSMLRNDEIDCVFVLTEFQGRGFGRKIMNYTINKAIESGIKSPRLCVFNGGRAIKLYEKLGFKTQQVNTAARIIFKGVSKHS